ncbi:MAG: ATP-binding protein [Deltaproteobacteria bacterium]|jgi:AAA+ ATPase superfamily predicted ATPase|nr:ATP-binding protein [Deltaproteobacteria bacterium]
MKKFTNRTEELKTLEEEFAKNTSTLTILYGRRRIGKTELIAEFLRRHNNNAFYFQAIEENEYNNLEMFRTQIADWTQNQLLAETKKGWEETIKNFVSYKPNEKKILVIDEFTYISASNPAFPSIFQRIWDLILSKSNVMVILCGSLVNMMYSQTLAYNSPLYGRRTSQIKLKQIPFAYYNEFFPKLSFRDRVIFYSVTGGVPKYIETFTDIKNIWDGITERILNKQSYLFEEPQFLLSREVSDVGSYFSIIRAIALGNRKLSDIASVIGKKATDITKYLKILIDLDLVEREVPITEAFPEKSKKGLYRLTDNFISFWFKYIYMYLANLNKGENDFVLSQIKKSLIQNHTAYVYEDICRERMWELNKQEKFGFRFNELGRFWDANTEIDIVGIESITGQIILAECKFSEKAKSAKVLSELKEKAAQVEKNTKNGHTAFYVIFSPAGFSADLQKIAKQDKNVLLVSD